MTSNWSICTLKGHLDKLQAKEDSKSTLIFTHIQDSHRLEKYLNIQDCLEKSLKMKFALKSTGKSRKGLEKVLNFTIYRRI